MVVHGPPWNEKEHATSQPVRAAVTSRSSVTAAGTGTALGYLCSALRHFEATAFHRPTRSRVAGHCRAAGRTGGVGAQSAITRLALPLVTSAAVQPSV
jgi:hypothetical protein